MSKQILVSKILHCLNAMVSNFDRIKLILIVFQQQLDTIYKLDYVAKYELIIYNTDRECNKNKSTGG